MTRRILVVDANAAFATMLQQGLEEMDGTQATTVGSGQEALQAIANTRYDLVIVDLDLPDVDALHLVQTLRREHPALRLMIMPLTGDTVPPELEEIDLQGVLPKPFFLPELPTKIEAVLAQPMGAEEASVEERAAEETVTPPATTLDPAQVIGEMSRLAQDVGAEAVLLTRDKTLIARAGRLPEEEVIALITVISESWRTSARVARILGKEQLRFEQSIEGAEYLLYSLGIADALVLSVVAAGRTHLGMIRHRAKETAETIRRLTA